MMKELVIHPYSRLFYSEQAQPFVYIADSLELVLCCGEGILIDQEKKPCQSHDLMLLQERQLYTFHVPANTYLLVSKLPTTIQEPLPPFDRFVFQHEELCSLCLLIAKQTGVEKAEDYLLQSYLYKLAYLILHRDGHRDVAQTEGSLVANEERMKQIHQIIYSQSDGDISLVSLAKQLHLTPQYVSLFFKEYFGCTFLHYVARIRLSKAMPDIQHTTKSLLSIAMEYGFANVRSFQNTFTQAIHCTPKQYRKKLQQRSMSEQVTREDPMYQGFWMTQNQQVTTPIKQKNYHITLQAKGQEKKLQHTWRRLMTVGRARLLLIEDIRKQLSEIQKDIGFEMIRFHGIFSEDMHVYDEDEQGNAIYNFHQINDALDFLLHIGLKPFVELGFMPKKLALHPEMTILDHMFIVSQPKDIVRWQELVQAFLKNCINRYGEEEVHSWNFEFWNNSGLDYDERKPSREHMFWQGTLEEYLLLYEATYRAVKEIHPNLRVGGPSCPNRLLSEFPENMTKYLQFMNKHHCMIDFITFHIYPVYEGESKDHYTSTLPPLKERVEILKKWMKKQNITLPLHITEWSTWGYREQPNFNDNCDKALYMIQGMVDTLDQIDSIGHWTFSDYTETMKTKENQIYSDKAGLLTSNGIKKVAYHAYTFMRKLGDIQLGKAENYIFTKKNKNFQLLLFSQQIPSFFHFTIKQIPNGTYEKKVTFLNSESGSSYDTWKKMGSRLEIMEEDVQYLKASALMSYVRETIEISDNTDQENRRVRPGEAIFIEWIYKY